MQLNLRWLGNEMWRLSLIVWFGLGFFFFLIAFVDRTLQVLCQSHHCIITKRNVKAQMEFQLPYYDVTAQHVYH